VRRERRGFLEIRHTRPYLIVKGPRAVEAHSGASFGADRFAPIHGSPYIHRIRDFFRSPAKLEVG
jgi:hypothetical protein